jgi:hypothetical protein
MKLTTFRISIDYSTVYIIDRGSPPQSHEDFFKEGVYTNEYSCLPSGVAVFSIYGVGGWDKVDVFLNEPVQLADDAVRAVQVPFKVTSTQGVFVGTIIEDLILDIPIGSYSLVVEQGFLVEPSGEIETGDTSMWCRMWFNATEDNIESQILLKHEKDRW